MSYPDQWPKGNSDRKDYLQFPPVEEVKKTSYFFPTDVTVADANGVIHCGQEMVLELGPKRIQDHVIYHTHYIYLFLDNNLECLPWKYI